MTTVRAHFPSGGQKSPADEIEVGPREEREHLRTVLGDAAIAHLAIAELALEHAEHMLDLGADLAEAAVASALALRVGFAFSFKARAPRSTSVVPAGWHPEKAAQQALPPIGPQTLVISLQNGIDGLNRLKPILEAETVIPGSAYIATPLRRPASSLTRANSHA